MAYNFSILHIRQEDGLLPPPDRIIHMQNGERPDVLRNGLLDTEIISGLIERYEEFRKGPHWCEESADALAYLELARDALHARSARRRQQGTYGKQAELSVLKAEESHEADDAPQS